MKSFATSQRSSDLLPKALVPMSPSESETARFNLVVNWFEELKERMGGN